MADIDLPVFAFAPNWANDVTETLEWRTDVIRSLLGHEQRRSLRLTPRRYFDATFNPVGNERAFMSLWLQRFAEKQFLLPLWHDVAKLRSHALVGDVRLDFDNTYREYETGGIAIIRRDAFSHEAIEITGQDDDGLDVAALTQDWPAGAIVHPARVAELESPTADMAAIVERVGQSRLPFRLTRDNPYTLPESVLAVYDGFPVMVREPNRAGDLQVRFDRLYEDTDNQTGRTYRRDEGGRAFPIQPHDWRAVGRKEHHELRAALYRLNGRQKAVWIPTWNQDALLARPLAPGSDRLDIGMIGYGYLGGPISGREHFFLEDDEGQPQIVKVTDTRAALGEGEERLDLSGAAGFAAAAGRKASFVELMRLDQDSIEITHYTDTDGVTDAAAAFRAFRPGRDPSGPLLAPATVAVKGSDYCGAPAAGEESPCLGLLVFTGWEYKAVFSFPTSNNTGPNGGSFFITLGGGSNLGGAVQFYYDSNGQYVPGAGFRQIQVATGGRTVTVYWTKLNPDAPVAPPTEMFLQLQGMGGNFDSYQNSVTFQRWDEEPRLLSTRVSQVVSPGFDSTGGPGRTLWPGARLFPERFFFGV